MRRGQAELVRVAADLERSMLLKLGPQPAAAARLAASADLQVESHP
jgi:hypothetical protein